MAKMKLVLLAGTALLGLASSEPTAHAQRVDFTYTGQLVTWTVPKTGTYQIIAFGAQGGNGVSMGGALGMGGRGAEIGGDFSLTAGESLQIAVGGAGEGGGETGGGGGGTFVIGTGNAPLVIAGGGGGGSGGTFNSPGQGGLTGPGGGPGVSVTGDALGGTGGNGGDSGGGGGGGGGFLRAGANARLADGGGEFPGLAGGAGASSGGFGGGGGGGGRFGGAGGGGGYGGGGGAGPAHGGGLGIHDPGGGGGSFDAGKNKILVADIWPGNGEVIIMEVSPQFAGTPGKANCHIKSVAALVRQYGGLDAAAAALGFDSVNALQEAIGAFCVA
jgi:hypothetical protein